MKQPYSQDPIKSGSAFVDSAGLSQQGTSHAAAAMLAVLLFLLVGSDAGASSLGTEFWYSGFLNDNNKAANGNYDFRATLYDAAVNGSSPVSPQTINNVAVANGLVQFSLDFGGSVFDGTKLWLELEVKKSNAQNFDPPLSPRLLLTATPYALYAPTAASANGVANDAVTSLGIKDASVTDAKIAGNQVVKSINGLKDAVVLQGSGGISINPNGNTLTIGGSGSTGWSLTGNSGTTAGVNFLGTTDNQPLEFRANNSRVLRLEPVFGVTGSSVNTIGGLSVNRVSNGVLGATIGGGGEGTAYGDSPNEVRASFGTIGGGAGNTIRFGVYATIAGGADNIAGYDVDQVGNFSAVGGGFANNAQGDYSTVPGGYRNWAPGAYSLAAGVRAKAVHDRSFVWNDSNQDTFSTGPNRFEVFTSGGAIFHTAFLTVSGDGGEQAYIGGDGLGNDVQIGSLSPSVSTVALYNAFNNTYMDAVVRKLTIVGGSDLAEPFQVSQGELPPGSVVIIDDEHSGQLTLSTQAYDTRVAGVISGANGIHAGISLRQEGKLEGGENVALSGRVYVIADASNGPIKPGDLLTTSAKPGHAMRVTDHVRAQGAVLGKAMGTLASGEGMVLLLVTLQ